MGVEPGKTADTAEAPSRPAVALEHQGYPASAPPVHVQSDQPVGLQEYNNPLQATAGPQGSRDEQAMVQNPVLSAPGMEPPVQGIPVKDVQCVYCMQHPPLPCEMVDKTNPRPVPEIMHCPGCHQDRPPKTDKVSGDCSCIAALVCCLCCGLIGLAISFCVDEWKDTEYRCPNCSRLYHTQKA